MRRPRPVYLGSAYMVPQANLAPINSAILRQPSPLPAGVFVQPDILQGQTVGGGDTQTAFFILRDEMDGASDPTTGQQNYETFVGPPYEAHRDDGSIEYIDPNAATNGATTTRPWWRAWGPPLALAALLGAAYMILRRPRRRRR